MSAGECQTSNRGNYDEEVCVFFFIQGFGIENIISIR